MNGNQDFDCSFGVNGSTKDVNTYVYTSRWLRVSESMTTCCGFQVEISGKFFVTSPKFVSTVSRTSPPEFRVDVRKLKGPWAVVNLILGCASWASGESNFVNISLVGGLEPWNFMTFHSVGNE
jgi:hypothetical protein